jgi:multiple sugar transport system permease protein
MTNIHRNSFQLWLFGPGAAAMVVVMFFVLIIVALWYLFFKEDLVVK